jgi:hypothetical protein
MNYAKVEPAKRGQVKQKTLTFIDVERLLQAADIVRRIDCDQLICFECAAKLRGVHRSTMHHSANRHSLTVFKLCCTGIGKGREYLDKEEVLALGKRNEKRVRRVYRRAK